jgi:hypothetical protein
MPLQVEMLVADGADSRMGRNMFRETVCQFETGWRGK